MSGRAAARSFSFVADAATAQRQGRYTVHGFLPAPFQMRKDLKGCTGTERDIAVGLSHPRPSCFALFPSLLITSSWSASSSSMSASSPSWNGGCGLWGRTGIGGGGGVGLLGGGVGVGGGAPWWKDEYGRFRGMPCSHRCDKEYPGCLRPASSEIISLRWWPIGRR